MNIDNYIDTIENFPKQWISFKDISPILMNATALSYVVDCLSANIDKNVDVIVGLDARWFIFWSLVAYKLQKPFVMVRKKWKLPWDIIEETYELEYGSNTQIIQVNSIKKWQKVAIIDDLLATWWTALCACNLVEKLWWIIQWLHFVVVLESLCGTERLNKYKITKIVSY